VRSLTPDQVDPLREGSAAAAAAAAAGKTTFIELFAGIGGFRLGLEAVGWAPVFASELGLEEQVTYTANCNGEVSASCVFGALTQNSAIPSAHADRDFAPSRTNTRWWATSHASTPRAYHRTTSSPAASAVSLSPCTRRLRHASRCVSRCVSRRPRLPASPSSHVCHPGCV